MKQMKTKKSIYICGPMTGIIEYNFHVFFKASEELEKQGYEVVNPAQLDIDAGYTLEKLKQLTLSEHIEFLKGAAKRDLDALQQCDAIAMLPGWKNSKGAKAELAVAQWLGLDEVYLDEPKQPDADGWIPHVPGDPMPCDGKLSVDVKFADSDTSRSNDARLADFWNDDPYNNWTGDKCPRDAQIIAWRPAQPKQPYNSDERAEWSNDCGKLDMGDYSSTATVQYAPGNSSYVDRGIRGSATGSCYAPDDPKGAAGALKAPMHLLPPDALIEIAKVMGEGARKYQPWNFIAARVCASTYIGAILRHWAEFAKGRDMDDGLGGSGLSHLSHIAANCMILLTAKQQGTLNDDRPKLK